MLSRLSPSRRLESHAIYRLDGTLVANGAADLFDGSILAGIVITELDTINNNSVWTGTQADGTQYGAVWPLGSDLPGVGISWLTDDRYRTPVEIL
ncbi:MAG: hypothetical protein JNK48_20280 [Bryobacterales bacterium]|nr:hypothetical protein [Bryobacterales bacterium]